MSEQTEVGEEITEEELEREQELRSRFVRIFFDVTDTDTQMKKIFTTSISNALKIKKLLKQGNRILKITRFGEGRNTKYAFKPAT